jgi:hypothetical protein
MKEIRWKRGNELRTILLPPLAENTGGRIRRSAAPFVLRRRAPSSFPVVAPPDGHLSRNSELVCCRRVFGHKYIYYNPQFKESLRCCMLELASCCVLSCVLETARFMHFLAQ